MTINSSELSASSVTASAAVSTVRANHSSKPVNAFRLGQYLTKLPDDPVFFKFIGNISLKDAACLRRVCKGLNRKFNDPRYFQITVRVLNWSIDLSIHQPEHSLKFFEHYQKSLSTHAEEAGQSLTPDGLAEYQRRNRDLADFYGEASLTATNRNHFIDQLKQMTFDAFSRHDATSIVKKLSDFGRVNRIHNIVRDPQEYHDYIIVFGDFDLLSNDPYIFDIIFDQLIESSTYPLSEDHKIAFKLIIERIFFMRLIPGIYLKKMKDRLKVDIKTLFDWKSEVGKDINRSRPYIDLCQPTIEHIKLLIEHNIVTPNEILEFIDQYEEKGRDDFLLVIALNENEASRKQQENSWQKWRKTVQAVKEQVKSYCSVIVPATATAAPGSQIETSPTYNFDDRCFPFLKLAALKKCQSKYSNSEQFFNEMKKANFTAMMEAIYSESSSLGTITRRTRFWAENSPKDGIKNIALDPKKYFSYFILLLGHSQKPLFSDLIIFDILFENLLESLKTATNLDHEMALIAVLNQIFKERLPSLYLRKIVKVLPVEQLKTFINFSYWIQEAVQSQDTKIVNILIENGIYTLEQLLNEIALNEVGKSPPDKIKTFKELMEKVQASLEKSKESAAAPSTSSAASPANH